MQTPQGATVELLREAHRRATADLTDEMALIEALGVQPAIVPGDSENFKITTPEDLIRAQARVAAAETRTGFGYDVHPFSSSPGRPLLLGGVHFIGAQGLEGHSDADVLLHAVTDAVLGAAALGDIGLHFPNTDAQWRNRDSSFFLRHASSLVSEAGWQIVNIDATVIAEAPRIMARAADIRAAIASAASVAVERVSVKATANERLGSIGRGEGIAAMAVATVRRP